MKWKMKFLTNSDLKFRKFQISSILPFSEFFWHFFSKSRDSLSFPEHFCEIPANFFFFFQNFIKTSPKNRKIHKKRGWKMKFHFHSGKNLDGFLLKFCDLSGAKVWKSCRSRKSWKNEYLVAIVAVDTAENGPPKVWRNWINYSVVSLRPSRFERWRIWDY